MLIVGLSDTPKYISMFFPSDSPTDMIQKSVSFGNSSGSVTVSPPYFSDSTAETE